MAAANEAKVRKAAQSRGPMASRLSSELADLARLVKSLVDPYRPELHYMRGPGPKWHAKHRPAAVDARAASGLFHVEA